MDNKTTGVADFTLAEITAIKIQGVILMNKPGLFNEVIESASEINPIFGGILESSVDYVPYLGKIYQTIKINRIIRRLKEHEKKLDQIGQLASNSVLSSQYINQRIFPIVFSDLFEEHEDAKINLILNGFENVFIEEKSEESIIINYYDTLRNLRYVDIKRFFYLTKVIGDTLFYFHESDEHALIRNIDKKLEYLGLILIKKKWNDMSGIESDIDRDDVTIPLYGERFVNFILAGEGLK